MRIFFYDLFWRRSLGLRRLFDEAVDKEMEEIGDSYGKEGLVGVEQLEVAPVFDAMGYAW